MNYAVVESSAKLTDDKKAILLCVTIDTEISPVMDYFEIFLDRMLLCRKAAEKLGLKFQLEINGQKHFIKYICENGTGAFRQTVRGKNGLK